MKGGRQYPSFTRAYALRDGTANIMWCSSPRNDARCRSVKGADISGRLSMLGPTEQVPNCRRVPDAGPCAEMYWNFPEASRGLNPRVRRGQERNYFGPAVRQGAKC